MNVVIFGAGTVGTALAKTLCEHQHDVRVIDKNREQIEHNISDLDVQGITGNCCDAVTLFQADILNADLTLAVTSLDEINLVGASLAKEMGSKRSVARIFNPTYRDFSTFDYQSHFHIDRMLSLEYLTAQELSSSIRRTGFLTVESFLRGGIEVQEVEVQPDSKSDGKSLSQLELPKQVRVGLLSSGKRAFIPQASDVIEAGDHVTLFGSRDAIDHAIKYFERKKPPRKDIIIAGGGEIGFNLAAILLGERFEVTMLESDQKRCEYLAQKLPHARVLKADATSRIEMEEARVGKADIFVAAMGRDEDNIVCGVEARELGSQQILSVVRRPDYTNVLEKLGINQAVSPREVMTRQVLGMVRGGPILAEHTFAAGQAIVWEIEVQAGCEMSRGPLKTIKLRNALIAAVDRQNYTWVPGADDTMQPGDTAIVLLHRDVKEEIRQKFLKPTT